MRPLNGRQISWLAGIYVLLTIIVNGVFIQASDAQFTSPLGRGTPKGTAGVGPVQPIHCAA